MFGDAEISFDFYRDLVLKKNKEAASLNCASWK